MKLQTLLEVLPFYTVQGKGNPDITDLKNHHEKVTSGDLFICIKGSDVDSHTLAKEAEQRGAVAVLSEVPLNLGIPVVMVHDTRRAMAILSDYFYNQPSRDLLLIGVTGTNGKTTTTHIIETVLNSAGRKTGAIGTLYVKTGDEIEESKNTTPDSLTLQQTFSKFIEKGIDSAVMEVSSHALYQGRVHGCDYDIAVFTNLTQDHLDYHSSMEEYRSAKGLLFSQLGNTYSKGSPKYAIINIDDPSADYFIYSTASHVITYGLNQHAHFRAENLILQANGTQFKLVTPCGEYQVSLKLSGQFNVYNTLAAIASSYVAGIPLPSILSAIEEIKGVSGRFELVDAGQDYSVIVDYAHTPDSLENVLKTIKTVTTGKIITVVGCGGNRDTLKRPIMANVACRYSQKVFFTSDNPRNENPKLIIDDMLMGVPKEEAEKYEVILDRKEAIFRAVSNARKGDTVLIAGKGHETYQIIGDRVTNFDDREVAIEGIKMRIIE
ncbi:UDP-N-acetylmuramoyl-L-alanyl-D-glutamate--2,6-diaminopimelate ligase [Bacillus pakistanensis]|uniref:UDP-N-acetylmuramoyl-L-alanyl-D-glutamate--2,6-diaminopimelate ligase n=1 Tax=Rossellomorea pakistanensis TaxID=992288 RepID=A0ABS2NFY2_9BACI|nr:UDP-N-acetylmuramoyl-L-alanyl-D-glutamate--2,6-diaminopimelate ligase [Bacillus pakistanensis]MBM7586737.1 UDP-N-acetylmuramoyl-L-alanyl-D-glutamate--2,6-diaminopimelate ligase [Bacillus pakistanensis]